jgi:phosphatidylglycerol:prolipoprotein diacylglycerol transferase
MPLFIPWFRLEGIPIPGLPQQVSIQPFGLLVVTGVILGARTAERRALRLGIAPDVIAGFIAYVVIIGFALGHVFDRLAYDPQLLWQDPLDLLMPWRSLSSFGGCFGAVIGAFVWKWRHGMKLTIPLDQVAFGMPVGWLFGRTGCFVVHDHPGRLTQFFLAVDDYQYGGLVVGPRHDLGLYEALWAAAVIPLFFWLDRRPRPHGFFIGVIAVLYAPYRFALDFLREVDTTYFGLTPGHYASLLAFVLGALTLLRAYRNPDQSIPAAMLSPEIANGEPQPSAAARHPDELTDP